MIKYSSPHITEEDIEMVSSILRGGHIAGRGSVVEAFEDAVKEYTGYRYAISVNSATSGLYLLFLYVKDYILLVNRNEGVYFNEHVVLVPPLTFVATMNAPLLAGFDVIIKEEMDVGNALNSPVSYSGAMVAHNDFSVIDHAQCLLPNMGVHDVSFGAVISTHAIKNITTGEGGVILTNRSDVAKFVRGMSDHGHGGTNYGHNFRMSSIQAGLGLVQLKRADEYLRKRTEIADYYNDTLDESAVWVGAKESSHHLYPIELDYQLPRNLVRSRLHDNGIMTQIHHEPLYSIAPNHPERDRISFDFPFNYPNAEIMWRRGFSLPIHNGMTFEDAEKVSFMFNRVIRELI